ncbi:hypothetical protein KK083_15240 [Fulvivirgaceae bacterium PWU4]|uniref:Uncharacterized protein n=1 Tax=Chryseosolibacter histidini TaxID=2782349 RepID=A0AAP2DL58_9BACT|nr:hypothetical protein [Chryseosolibacter histidini]MBT1698246.1 hypothetical protein [Chryseosolibacter histidini]
MSTTKNTISFDEASFNNDLQALEKVRDCFQDLLTEFNKMKLFKISSIQELLDLIAGRDEYVRKRLEDIVEVPKFGMFAVSKKKAVELIELDLFAVNRLIDFCADCRLDYSVHLNISGKDVSINQEQIDRLRDGYSMTASSSGQVELWKAHNAAAEALNKLNALLQPMGSTITKESVYKALFAVDEGKVSPNTWFYQSRRREFNNI